MFEQFAEFTDRCGFPAEAVEDLLKHKTLLQTADPQPVFDRCRELLFSGGDPWPALTRLAEQTGIHPYVVHLLFLIDSAPQARENYAQAGLSEALYWDSMKDIRYKMEETKQVYGIWGVYCGGFLGEFLKMQIFCLGRLQFEILSSQFHYEKDGHVLQPGDPVINVHIPSFGKLPREAVLDAYARAAEFFADRFPAEIRWFHCETWMLDPAVLALLPEGNIRKFAADYEVVKAFVDPTQDDRYRIFGLPAHVPVEQYPENNTMQRNLKQWLLEGNAMGMAFGLFLWKDGKIMPHPGQI